MAGFGTGVIAGAATRISDIRRADAEEREKRRQALFASFQESATVARNQSSANARRMSTIQDIAAATGVNILSAGRAFNRAQGDLNKAIELARAEGQVQTALTTEEQLSSLGLGPVEPEEPIIPPQTTREGDVIFGRGPGLSDEEIAEAREAGGAAGAVTPTSTTTREGRSTSFTPVNIAGGATTPFDFEGTVGSLNSRVEDLENENRIPARAAAVFRDRILNTAQISNPNERQAALDELTTEINAELDTAIAFEPLQQVMADIATQIGDIEDPAVRSQLLVAFQGMESNEDFLLLTSRLAAASTAQATAAEPQELRQAAIDAAELSSQMVARGAIEDGREFAKAILNGSAADIISQMRAGPVGSEFVLNRLNQQMMRNTILISGGFGGGITLDPSGEIQVGELDFNESARLQAMLEIGTELARAAEEAGSTIDAQSLALTAIQTIQSDINFAGRSERPAVEARMREMGDTLRAVHLGVEEGLNRIEIEDIILGSEDSFIQEVDAAEAALAALETDAEKLAALGVMDERIQAELRRRREERRTN